METTSIKSSLLPKDGSCFSRYSYFGRHVVLDGLLFYPEEGDRLEIGVRQVLNIKRKLAEQAKAEGSAEITTVYNRQGKGRNERTIIHTRSLE